ncbi:NAD(P)-dependent alcohol dehydrogenase [Kiritimatiellaeota bacterium B1221]|nr:NAD(P)-dependent alcohol dehydrogenase [Kiritimatiellaeota bacterium B1221]
MKAARLDRYGPPEVMHIDEKPAPKPGHGEIRVAVHASSVTSGDARIRRADPPLVRLFFGLFRPKYDVLGYEFAGTVESLGPETSRFKVGDRVFGATGFRFGATAEFLVIKENATVSLMPESWSFTQAAAIPFGATTARYFLEDKGHIQESDRVLIHGASGAVGVAAIQIARMHGTAVDGLCGPKHLELIQSLGAERVLDYSRETPGNGAYDLIFDAAGKLKASTAKAWLRSGGRFVSVQKGLAKDRASDYPDILAWMESGKLQPVIDQIYGLDDIAEAHRKVDGGHKTGAVVIQIRG